MGILKCSEDLSPKVIHPAPYLPIQMPWNLPKPQQIRSCALNTLENIPDATELETLTQKKIFCLPRKLAESHMMRTSGGP